MSSVTVRFRWTIDEYVRAYRFHRGLQVRPLLRWTVVVMAVSIGGICIWSLYVAGFSWPSALLFLGCVYLLGLRQLDQDWAVRRKYRRLRNFDQLKEWTFSDDRIAVNSEDGAGHFVWSSITKWIETPLGFLIYPQEDICFWIPLDAFESDNDVDVLREMARKKVAKIGTAV